jgi:hypothetical protein
VGLESLSSLCGGAEITTLPHRHLMPGVSSLTTCGGNMLTRALFNAIAYPLGAMFLIGAAIVLFILSVYDGRLPWRFYKRC